MTNEEAIEILSQESMHRHSDGAYARRLCDALGVAIAALSAPKPPLRVTKDGVCVPVVPPIEGLREAVKLHTTYSGETKIKTVPFGWWRILKAAERYLELTEGA